GTVRRERNAYCAIAKHFPSKLYDAVEVRNFSLVQAVFGHFRPDAVINAGGIVKQRAESKQSLESIEINSLLPHRLALECQAIGARLVHVSTDCVFSGRKGRYAEVDFADADDLYGRSKFLGEVTGSEVVTLRTSIIGPELAR